MESPWWRTSTIKLAYRKEKLLCRSMSCPQRTKGPTHARRSTLMERRRPAQNSPWKVTSGSAHGFEEKNFNAVHKFDNKKVTKKNLRLSPQFSRKKKL